MSEGNSDYDKLDLSNGGGGLTADNRNVEVADLDRSDGNLPNSSTAVFNQAAHQHQLDGGNKDYTQLQA